MTKLADRLDVLEAAVLTNSVTTLKDARAGAGLEVRDHSNPYQPAKEPAPEAEEEADGF